MVPNQIDSTASLENHLKAAHFADMERRVRSILTNAAVDIEASNAVVLLMEPFPLIRPIYAWPDEFAPLNRDCEVDSELRAELKRLDNAVVTNGTIARFLSAISNQTAQSFLLLRWPEQGCCKVLTAFGYAAKSPVHCSLPSHISANLCVAAFAVWALQEIDRLRRELRTTAERLGHRKEIERAKGILQVRQGWTEQEAYEYLRKLSRQRRRSLSDTAEQILRESRVK